MVGAIGVVGAVGAIILSGSVFAAVVEERTSDGLPLARAVFVNSHATLVINDPRATDSVSSPRGYDYFGDSIVPLRIEVFGSAGASIYLRGQVLQRTGEFDAALGQPFSISETRLFDSSARFEANVAVPLPPVRRASQVVFQIDACSNRDVACRVAGRLSFEVFPRDILTELACCFKKRTLILDENGGNVMASFLKAQQISFRSVSLRDLSEHQLSERDGLVSGASSKFGRPLIFRVRISDAKSELRNADDPITTRLLKSGFGIVDFRDGNSAIPVVIVRQAQPGLHVEVRTPLVDALEDRPRAQLLLLDVIRLASDDLDPTNSVDPKESLDD